MKIKDLRGSEIPIKDLDDLNKKIELTDKMRKDTYSIYPVFQKRIVAYWQHLYETLIKAKNKTI